MSRRSALSCPLLLTPLLLLACSTAIANVDPFDPTTLFAGPDEQCQVSIPDFSYAGYAYAAKEPGPARGEVIDVTRFGAIADDGHDDSKALLAALQAAAQIDGPVVVQLPPGRLIVSEVLRIERSDIVLRGHGSGAGGSELYFPRPLRMVDRSNELDELRRYLVKNDKHQVEPQNNVNALFSEYSWAGGFIWVGPARSRPSAYLPENDVPAAKTQLADVSSGRQGKRQLELAGRGKLKVGDVVQIRWFNREGRDGPLLDALYGPQRQRLNVGAHHWQFPERPLIYQTTQITALDGNRVTIADPLLHDIDRRLRADVASWEHLSEVGIEDIALVFPEGGSFGHHQEEGYNGVFFTGVFNGWIRNLRVKDGDSGVLTGNSANLTLSDIVIEGKRPAHYAVHIGNVHNVLVRDLTVFNPVIHTFSINTQATRNVFLRATAWQEPVIDQHAGANHQNLFDNLTVHVRARPDKQGKPWYPIWNGSGAGYWEPGHGRYNTTWNLRVVVEGGAAPGESVRLAGEDEGPDARLVGISGNREFSVDYRPGAYLAGLNQRPWRVASLYEYQLAQRKAGGPAPVCLKH